MVKIMYKKRLKDIRTSKKYTQKDIANILEISEVSYTNYENEYYIIPVKYLNVICNNFHVPLDYIFNLTNNTSYKDSLNDIDIVKAGLRLKEFRKENKLTQDKVANLVNTNRSVIANYERGRTIIATPFLYTICKKYHVSADYLLGKIDEPKYLM